MRGQATVAQMWAQMFHLLLGYPLRFGLYLFQEPTVSLVLCTSQSQRGDVLWINITLSWHWWNKEGKRQRYNIRVDANPRGRNLASFRDQQEDMIVASLFSLVHVLTCVETTHESGFSSEVVCVRWDNCTHTIASFICDGAATNEKLLSRNCFLCESALHL